MGLENVAHISLSTNSKNPAEVYLDLGQQRFCDGTPLLLYLFLNINIHTVQRHSYRYIHTYPFAETPGFSLLIKNALFAQKDLDFNPRPDQ